MSKYITHTITVQHKDGVRQHHVMASDDASAIHQVPLNPEHERIVGIRRTEHANVESRRITHSASFKTDDLFGGSGHITTHYISVGPRGSVEKEIKKMTDKNPQLGTPVGSNKIMEGTRITYKELVELLEGRAAAEGRHAEREWAGEASSEEPAPRKPAVSAGNATASAPAKPNRFSTMQHGTASPVHHASLEDAHLHAHLNAMKTKQPHSIIHNGVKVATHSYVGGQHHVEIH